MAVEWKDVKKVTFMLYSSVHLCIDCPVNDIVEYILEYTFFIINAIITSAADNCTSHPDKNFDIVSDGERKKFISLSRFLPAIYDYFVIKGRLETSYFFYIKTKKAGF